MSGPMTRMRSWPLRGRPSTLTGTRRTMLVPGITIGPVGLTTITVPGLTTEPVQTSGHCVPVNTDSDQRTTEPTGTLLVGRQSWIGMFVHVNGGRISEPLGTGIGMGPFAVQATGCGTPL